MNPQKEGICKMFLAKYLNNVYFEQLLSIYDVEYLNNLDEENFVYVYRVLKKYNFYFIEDIILKYLEIFELDYKYVEKEIIKLKKELGNNFTYLIGNDMKYLDEIIDNFEEE